MRPDCSGAPGVEPFGARRWQACSGPNDPFLEIEVAGDRITAARVIDAGR